jgi:Asp-tRNA(Asn)/Glu-tRNA(Gln) amidotransferase A subunit family amidase
VSIKDLIATRGIRTTRGSKLWETFVPEQDAPVVERVRAAGAIVLGKTNTPELGWKGVTDNPLFGPTRNPWNLERTPGGSTGGGSAQVAAGLGPIGDRYRWRRLAAHPGWVHRVLRVQTLVRARAHTPAQP